MGAQVIAFPKKPFDNATLARLGDTLREAVPLPGKDADLDFLMQIADRRVGNIVDYDVDCYIVRLDRFDARKACASNL